GRALVSRCHTLLISAGLIAALDRKLRQPRGSIFLELQFHQERDFAFEGLGVRPEIRIERAFRWRLKNAHTLDNRGRPYLKRCGNSGGSRSRIEMPSFIDPP